MMEQEKKAGHWRVTIPSVIFPCWLGAVLLLFCVFRFSSHTPCRMMNRQCSWSGSCKALRSCSISFSTWGISYWTDELQRSHRGQTGRGEEWSWGVKVVNGWRGENYWYKVGYENRGYGSMQVKKRKEGRWRVSTMVMLKEERLLVRNKVLNKCRKDRGTF